MRSRLSSGVICPRDPCAWNVYDIDILRTRYIQKAIFGSVVIYDVQKDIRFWLSHIIKTKALTVSKDVVVDNVIRLPIQ